MNTPYQDPNSPIAQQSYQISYSPFWAIVIVFFIFSVFESTRFVNTIQQWNVLRKSLANPEYEQILAQEKKVASKLSGLSEDLLKLAPNHAAARQLVNEFIKTRSKSPSSGEQTSNTSPSTSPNKSK